MKRGIDAQAGMLTEEYPIDGEYKQVLLLCMGLTPTKGSDGKSRFRTGRLKPTFYDEKTGKYDHESRIKEHDPR